MAPILGIYASSNYQRIAPDSGAMFPIAMSNVGSAGASTITFSSIPSTYKHLQLRALWRANGGDGTVNVRFNSDSGSNYSFHWLYGQGSSATTYYGTSQTSMQISYNWSSVSPGYYGSAYSGLIIDVLDYGSTSKNKTIRSLNGIDYSPGGQVHLDSGLWMNSSTAVNSITLTYSESGKIFQQYSQFALYGIKG